LFEGESGLRRRRLRGSRRGSLASGEGPDVLHQLIQLSLQLGNLLAECRSFIDGRRRGNERRRGGGWSLGSRSPGVSHEVIAFISLVAHVGRRVEGGRDVSKVDLGFVIRVVALVL